MIKFIRSFLLLFSFLIFGAGAFFVNFTIVPLAKFFVKEENLPDFYSNMVHKIWKIFIKWLCFIKLIKLDIKNPDELTNIKNKIIVSTHPSFIDVVILVGLIPKTTCIAKEALSRNFLMSNIVNTIFITNEANLDEFKVQTKKMLDEGFNVIIFPTGIRHRKNEFPKIKKGAATIAVNAGKNIVPLKLYSDFDFLFIHQPIWEAGEKTVTFSIEKVDEIDVISELSRGETEIVQKKNITKMIESSLYK